MKKTVLFVADPETPRPVFGDGIRELTGHAAGKSEPAIVEVGDAAVR